MFYRLSRLSRESKTTLLVGTDLISLPLALWFGFALRLGEWWPQQMISVWWLFLAAAFIGVPIFIWMGLYRTVLRHVGSKTFVTIAKATTILTLILLALVLMSATHGVPRSVFVTFWLLGLLFVAGSRFALRDYIRSYGKRNIIRQRVAIYGAGEAGAELAKALEAGWEYSPIAFLDDNVEKHRGEIHGIKVYPPAHLENLIGQNGVSQVLLALPSLTHHKRHKIIENLEPYAVHIRSIPGVTDLVSGRAEYTDIREVDTGDVLGRDVVPPIAGLIEQCVRGKNVMVTGAGGSIGSELCRQIAEYGPSKLILFEQSEFALYKIEKELETYSDKLEIIAVLGSVTHARRIETVLKSFSVHTVYHAAAYKHVPLVEQNPIEGLQNNVFGTWRTAEAAKAAGVETFVLIWKSVV